MTRVAVRAYSAAVLAGVAHRFHAGMAARVTAAIMSLAAADDGREAKEAKEANAAEGEEGEERSTATEALAVESNRAILTLHARLSGTERRWIDIQKHLIGEFHRKVCGAKTRGRYGKLPPHTRAGRFYRALFMGRASVTGSSAFPCAFQSAEEAALHSAWSGPERKCLTDLHYNRHSPVFAETREAARFDPAAWSLPPASPLDPQLMDFSMVIAWANGLIAHMDTAIALVKLHAPTQAAKLVRERARFQRIVAALPPI